MSRAFTKEDDAGDDIPEKPVPPGPNYVTPQGLEMLKSSARELAERRREISAHGGDTKPIDRDLRYLEARISGAILVPPGSGPEARFGALVTLEDEAGKKTSYKIVGEDEARTGPGLLAWTAPLAQSLLGAKAGGKISWQGPGSAQYTVAAVEYRVSAE